MGLGLSNYFDHKIVPLRFKAQQMKNLLLILALALMGSTTILAQNNETIKEVVTVTRVITNNGSQVLVTEEKARTTASGMVMVQGDSIENQNMTEQITVKTDTSALVKNAFQDSLNQAQVLEIKKQRALALKASIELQKLKAEAQKKELEEQYKARLKALEDQKKALMKQPNNELH
jgi:hypothetical protein